MTRWIGPGLIALAMLLELTWGAATALAQSTAPAAGSRSTTASSPTAPSTSSTSSAGAYDRLSPGNQKIARALYEAQVTETGGATGTTAPGGTATGPRRLTLDEIAAQKQSGQGWGQIFKDMRSRGLVEEKNLGQIVSRSSRESVVTTASGRMSVTGGRDHSTTSYGNGRGGGDAVGHGAGAGPTHGRSGPSPGGGTGRGIGHGAGAGKGK